MIIFCYLFTNILFINTDSPDKNIFSFPFVQKSEWWFVWWILIYTSNFHHMKAILIVENTFFSFHFSCLLNVWTLRKVRKYRQFKEPWNIEFSLYFIYVFNFNIYYWFHYFISLSQRELIGNDRFFYIHTTTLKFKTNLIWQKIIS